MSEHPVKGSLRIPQQNLERDLGFIREYVVYLSDPQPSAGVDQQAAYYRAEFEMMPARWRALRPQLAKLGIRATQYEDPDLLAKAQQDEAHVLDWLERRYRQRLILAIGVAMALAGLVLWAFNLHSPLIGWLIGVGLAVALIGGVSVRVSAEKDTDQRGTGRVDRW